MKASTMHDGGGSRRKTGKGTPGIAWIEGDLEAEQFLPVQFHPSEVDGSIVNPEKRLMLAVLEQAVRDWCRCLARPRAKHRRELEELRDWFTADDASWPFAFESICDVLGFDAGSVRERMLGARAQGDGASGGIAAMPTFRRRTGTPLRAGAAGAPHRHAA